MARRKTSSQDTIQRSIIPVVDLCGRAEGGDSRPWIVEGADGFFYFLKRDNVSREHLVMDYLMSRLAEECGLPVPEVRLLDLSKLLLDYSVVDDSDTLTPGVGSGSLRVSFAEDLRTPHLRSIPEETQLRCLCFDWWTRNPARRLDRLGGDPNALWDPILQKVQLIGHGHCLDPSFDADEFWREHAFRDARPFLKKTFLTKWRRRFESAIYHLERLWNEMPEDWLVASGRHKPISFTRQDIEVWLMKPNLPTDGVLME